VKNIEINGPDAMGFNLGFEMLNMTIGNSEIGTSLFLDYVKFPSGTITGTLPPYYSYEQRLKNFENISFGLHIRGNVSKTFHLDHISYFGLGTHRTSYKIDFILPGGVMSDGEIAKIIDMIGIEQTTASYEQMQTQTAKSWLLEDIDIYMTHISLPNSGNNTNMIRSRTMNFGLVTGLGYDFELLGGLMAELDLYVDFLHISNRRDSASSKSAKMFDIVPGLNIDSTPFRLVRTNLSFRYRKPISGSLTMKDSFEFGVDFVSLDGIYEAGIKYSIGNTGNSTLGLHMGYRF
jgi:hypothetical protein